MRSGTRVTWGLFAGAGTVLALLGALSHPLNRDLLSFFPEPTPIGGNPAVCLLALGLAVLLEGRRASRILAGFAALFAGLTFLQYPLHIDLSLDQLLFDPFRSRPGDFPGRMAPHTALAIALLGLALLTRARLSVVMAGGAFVVGLAGVLGYTSADAGTLSQLGQDKTIALPTALSLACTAFAVILWREREYFARISVGGTLVRRVGPAVILVPMLGGAFLLKGITDDWFDAAAGIWVLSMLSVATGLGALLWLARVLDRQERERSGVRSLLAETTANLSEGLCLRREVDGTVLSVNPTLERIFGYEPGTIEGTRALLLTEENELVMRKALAANGAWTGEAETKRCDGSVFWCSVKASLFDHPDEGRLRVALYHDITDRRVASQQREQAEGERERAIEELRRSNQELEEFAHVASHDLSEPLRVIGGFVGLLQRRYEGKLDDDADRFIGATVSGVERMQALIDALLAYSRVGSGDLQRVSFDASSAARTAVTSLAARIEETGASVVCEQLPRIEGDAGLMERVFQNLISNGIKFANGDAPHVQVSAEREVAGWVFHVADNGEGIDPRHAERIFGMFQRLHGREMPGTGIGLPITRRIVEKHGGRIWVEPADGGGSVFSFTVPDPVS